MKYLIALFIFVVTSALATDNVFVTTAGPVAGSPILTNNQSSAVTFGGNVTFNGSQTVVGASSLASGLTVQNYQTNFGSWYQIWGGGLNSFRIFQGGLYYNGVQEFDPYLIGLVYNGHDVVNASSQVLYDSSGNLALNWGARTLNSGWTATNITATGNTTVNGNLSVVGNEYNSGTTYLNAGAVTNSPVNPFDIVNLTYLQSIYGTNGVDFALGYGTLTVTNLQGNGTGLTNVTDATNHFFAVSGANVTVTQTNTSSSVGYIVSAVPAGLSTTNWYPSLVFAITNATSTNYFILQPTGGTNTAAFGISGNFAGGGGTIAGNVADIGNLSLNQNLRVGIFANTSVYVAVTNGLYSTMMQTNSIGLISPPNSSSPPPASAWSTNSVFMWPSNSAGGIQLFISHYNSAGTRQDQAWGTAFTP